jgi:ubiquitin-protein ligase
MNPKRHLSELAMAEHFRTENCSLKPRDPNLNSWDLTVTSDVNSPFHGQQFKLEITVPEKYPFKPPVARFLTPISLPCVRPDGTIDIDILGENWSPAMTIGVVAMSLCTVINDCPYDYVKNLQETRTQNFKLELIATALAPTNPYNDIFTELPPTQQAVENTVSAPPSQ